MNFKSMTLSVLLGSFLALGLLTGCSQPPAEQPAPTEEGTMEETGNTPAEEAGEAAEEAGNAAEEAGNAAEEAGNAAGEAGEAAGNAAEGAAEHQ